jgi:Rieske 2Fe-2S family protein
MSFKPRATLPNTAFTLPARYYTDQTLFEREQDVFYRGMWVGVARLEDLPGRGGWITRNVAGDSILIVRQDGDEVRAFYNLCRHRGTQLCHADRGEFTGAIRCPYHAWTYDYDGRLAGAPHMDGSPGFNKNLCTSMAAPMMRSDISFSCMIALFA